MIGFALLALSPAGIGQAPLVQAERLETEETVEEIVVIGTKPLRTMRFQIYQAEEDFLDVFNSLNSDDDFDVHCTTYAPTGSHVNQRYCVANFVLRFESDEAQRWMLERDHAPAATGRQSPSSWVGFQKDVRFRAKSKQLRQEFDRLIAASPELRDVLQKFNEAQETYEAERKRRCDGSIVCQ